MTYFIPIDSLMSLPERIWRLVIDLDEGQVFDISKEQRLTNFTLEASYKVTGTKTFNVSTFIDPGIATEPFVHTYVDAVYVTDTHDDINTALYDVFNTTFQPPITSQPQIYINDWGVESVFNKTLLQIQDNLDYLIQKTYFYDCSDIHFIGWYGAISSENVSSLLESLSSFSPNHNWTWSQIASAHSALSAVWSDFNNLTNSKYKDSGKWSNLVCGFTALEDTSTAITDVIVNILSPNQLTDNNDCFNSKRWHVTTPLLSAHINDGKSATDTGCYYRGMFMRDDIVFLASDNTINVRNDDVIFSKFGSTVSQLSRNLPFIQINAIAQGKGNSIFVCDSGNNSVTNFVYNKTDYREWGQGFLHQGLGSSTSKYKFNAPVDVCVDLHGNVFVCDKNNSCVKMYTARGEWISTLTLPEPTLSLTVDSNNRLHVLTTLQIYVFELTGFNLINTYTFDNVYTPTRIRANFSKEIIYVCSDNEIIKYFKNGKKYCKPAINLTGITDVYQDSDRNLYILLKNQIVKYYDPMTIINNTNDLSLDYWSRDNIKIKRDEFVQDWVYNRALHRLWDNIEIFRSCLKYRYDNSCKSYTTPTYTKEQIFIAQNEIVTSAVINRCLKYLWVNLQTLYKYFNNTCT